MKEYYVVWSIFDHEMDDSHTLCRAILLGDTTAEVQHRADTLGPYAITWFRNNIDSRLFDIDPAAVEVTLRPLDEWLAEQRAIGNELPTLAPDEEDDEEDEEE